MLILDWAERYKARIVHWKGGFSIGSKDYSSQCSQKNFEIVFVGRNPEFFTKRFGKKGSGI